MNTPAPLATAASFPFFICRDFRTKRITAAFVNDASRPGAPILRVSDADGHTRDLLLRLSLRTS